MEMVPVIFPKDVIPLMGKGICVLLWELSYYLKKKKNNPVETLVSNRRIIPYSLH